MLGCAAAVAFVAAVAAAQPETEKPKEQPKQPAEQPRTEQPKAEQPKADKPAEPAKEKFVYVSVKTSMGEFFLELNAEKAPLSVENFLKYVDSGHYDGTIFHRVIDGFMVQGGGFTPDMKQKATNPPIKNEWKNGLKNERGTIAMARTNVADSATSQFFINVKDNSFLDQPRDGAAYAVFGKVSKGMDVVDKIKAVKTGVKNGMGDVPVTTVTIEKVTRSTAEAATEKKG
ncbi:MAG: peptidyl-prolyl cis-trans isomerase [Leptolyngbya sp. PLA1]|nr:peptidyl-prolyl cis-trans isomerase [Leptolyngbya sp. PLA1]